MSEITNDGKHFIEYNGDDVKTINISTETWRYGPVASAHTGKIVSLPSTEQRVLNELMKAFGKTLFMHHHAQAFEQFPLTNSYVAEEAEFTKTVHVVKRASVPLDANVKSSHVVYKAEVNYNASLKLKARIAPQGNEYTDKQLMRTECSVCAPVGIRVVTTVAIFRGWHEIRIDLKKAFLQTGPAQRDVYVIPPTECRHRDELWLLLAAAHGLVN